MSRAPLPTGLARQPCWSDPRSGCCCAWFNRWHMALLFTGNGSGGGCGRWCCSSLRFQRMEGMSSSAVGVHTCFCGGVPGHSLSITGVRWSCLLAQTHHTGYGYRGFFHVGRYMRSVHRHTKLHGGSLQALDGCWLIFNGFARALACMSMSDPRCIGMLSFISTHCTHRIITI